MASPAAYFLQNHPFPSPARLQPHHPLQQQQQQQHQDRLALFPDHRRPDGLPVSAQRWKHDGSASTKSPAMTTKAAAAKTTPPFDGDCHPQRHRGHPAPPSPQQRARLLPWRQQRPPSPASTGSGCDGSSSEVGAEGTGMPAAGGGSAVLVEKPGPYDVLLGRGKSHKNWPGNQRYQAIVAKNRERYFRTNSQSNKRAVINDVVAQMQVSGQFLKKSRFGDHWQVVDLYTVKTKLAHALQYRQRRNKKGEDSSNAHEGACGASMKRPAEDSLVNEQLVKKLHRADCEHPYKESASFTADRIGSVKPSNVPGTTAELSVASNDYRHNYAAARDDGISEEYTMAYNRMMQNPEAVLRAKAAAAAAANHRAGMGRMGDGDVDSPDSAPVVLVKYREQEEMLRRLSELSDQTYHHIRGAPLPPPPRAYQDSTAVSPGHCKPERVNRITGGGSEALEPQQLKKSSSATSAATRQNPYEKMLSLLHLASEELSGVSHKQYANAFAAARADQKAQSAMVQQQQREEHSFMSSNPQQPLHSHVTEASFAPPSMNYQRRRMKRSRRPAVQQRLDRLEGLDSVINEVLGSCDD